MIYAEKLRAWCEGILYNESPVLSANLWGSSNHIDWGSGGYSNRRQCNTVPRSWTARLFHHRGRGIRPRGQCSGGLLQCFYIIRRSATGLSSQWAITWDVRRVKTLWEEFDSVGQAWFCTSIMDCINRCGSSVWVSRLDAVVWRLLAGKGESSAVIFKKLKTYAYRISATRSSIAYHPMPPYINLLHHPARSRGAS